MKNIIKILALCLIISGCNDSPPDKICINLGEKALNGGIDGAASLYVFKESGCSLSRLNKFIKCIDKSEPVNIQDLQDAGFSPEEIEKHQQSNHCAY